MTNLVLYDGLCGLCNSTVLWLLRIDCRRILTFAPLQGETAKQFPLPQNSETIVYIFNSGSQNQKMFLRSDAILEILRTVGGLWKVAVIFLVIPRNIRDTLYDWIARNRYRWFGKYDECKLPSVELRHRFLP